MLGKLIKHEFRATARIMLPVMGALLALALLANLSLRALTGDATDLTVLRMLFVLIVIFFAIGIVATAVMAVVIMVSRFYRNLLKDEGYLMFTLPVSVHELVWSKLIVSLVWFLATGVLISLVMMLTVMNLSETNLQMILVQFPRWSEIQRILKEYGIESQVFTLVFQAILAVFLSSVVTCLHFYAAMAMGHMFTKNKVLLSVVFFVGMSFVFNLMEMGYGMVGISISDPSRWETMGGVEGLRFLSTVTWHGIFLSAVQGAVLYLATVLGLRKGLNLE